MSLLAFLASAALLSVGEACEDELNKGQQPGNTCSGKHRDVVEAELNRVWRDAVPEFRRQDREWETLYNNPGFFEHILEEQRGWIKYREAVCAHERFKSYKSSSAIFVYNSCMVDMALSRIKYLKNIAEQEMQ